MTTIKKILDSYAEHLTNTVTERRGKIAIKNLAPLFGCTPKDVSRNIDSYVRKRTASHGTINRELSVLQAALRFSFKRGDIDFLPAIQRLPSPPPRSKYLSRDEVSLLLEASKPYKEVHDFIQIALMTGQRKEAILSLTWEQVDFLTGLIDFNDPSMPLAHRRKRRGIVPMSASLRAHLNGLQRVGHYVIHRNGKKVTDIRSDWKKIMDQTGLSITPHILRHTVATHLAQNNVPITQISRLLGHSNTNVTERVYAKFSPDFCRQAVAHLNV